MTDMPDLSNGTSLFRVLFAFRGGEIAVRIREETTEDAVFEASKLLLADFKTLDNVTLLAVHRVSS